MKQIIEKPSRPIAPDEAALFVRNLNLGCDALRDIADRVKTVCDDLEFPSETLSIKFEVQQFETELRLRFYVNGNKETYVIPLGPGVKQWQSFSDEIIKSVRILPWRLLVTALGTIGGDAETTELSIPNIWNNDEDLDPINFALRPASHLTHLKSFYRHVYPAWRHGTEVYRANRDFPNWCETVKGEIKRTLKAQWSKMGDLTPDPSVFDQLIERFKNPEEAKDVIKLQQTIRDRSMPATAGELALDHAAHLCGAELYEYSIRHLKTLKSDRPSNYRQVK